MSTATATATVTAAATAPAASVALEADLSAADLIELHPAPRREPPFDDERPRRLSLVGPLDQPLPFHEAPQPSRLRLSREVDDFDPQPTSRQHLPDPDPFTRRLLIAIIETGTGRRSARQLLAYTSPSVQAGLARDAGRIERLGTAARPATLHSLHLDEPADGVIEAAAVVRLGDRFRAIALRLEGLDGRWRCVRLQIG